jgi:hypothetical protein
MMYSLIFLVITLQVLLLIVSFRNSMELKRMNATADSLAAEISGLQTDVTNDTTVVGSAVTLIQGFSTQLAAAVAAAVAAGATPDQLSALNGLQTTINTNASTLAAAVAANTPAAPPAAQAQASRRPA